MMKYFDSALLRLAKSRHRSSIYNLMFILLFTVLPYGRCGNMAGYVTRELQLPFIILAFLERLYLSKFQLAWYKNTNRVSSIPRQVLNEIVLFRGQRYKNQTSYIGHIPYSIYSGRLSLHNAQNHANFCSAITSLHLQYYLCFMYDIFLLTASNRS